MSELISLSQMEELDDVQLRAIGKRVAKTIILAAEKATAHYNDPHRFPLPADTSSFEQIFLTRFKQLSEAKRKAASIRVMASVNASAQERKNLYGDLEKIDLTSAVDVFTQLNKLAVPDTLKLAPDKADQIKALTKQLSFSSPKTPYIKAELRIHEVKCLDETSSSIFGEAGGDKIDLGGTYVKKDFTTSTIPKFRVGSDFDDGERKGYSPPKPIVNITFGSDNVWPKYLNATLCLAEIDHGGFVEFLNTLAEKISEKIKEELNKLITGIIGAAIGGAIGGWIGALVGSLIGLVFERIVDWIKSYWEDDMFPPVLAQLMLENPFACPKTNQRTSDIRTATFKGHGGKYRVTYDWNLN